MENEKLLNFGKKALSRTVLSEQIRDIIAESILSGELMPGDRVTEKNMAQKLGVSQAPVRDAIRDLVLMGFLKSEPFKGATVRSFTQEDLNEVYLVRASLESLGARLAAPLITDEDIQKLEKILKDMVAAAKKGDVLGSSRLNTEFHGSILEISGNRLLLKLMNTLHFGYWTIVTTRRPEFKLEYIAERHKEILDALKTRNANKAMRAMQKHIEDLGNPSHKNG